MHTHESFHQLAAMINLVDQAKNTPLHDAIRVPSGKNTLLLLDFGEDVHGSMWNGSGSYVKWIRELCGLME